MSGITRRYFLRKREKKLFFDDVSRTLEIDPESTFGPKPQIEVVETSKHKIYLVNGLPLLARSKEDLFPTLYFKERLPLLPKIIVNMGAIQHICNGADVMAPGIVEMQGDFKEKDLVLVLDEKNKKPIAIARSLLDSKTAKTLRRGKMFKNLNYVGDDVWNVVKTS